LGVLGHDSTKKLLEAFLASSNDHRRGYKMSEIKPVLLRLRTSTIEALKKELELSAHRSQSSLADEMLAAQIASKIRQRSVQSSLDGQAGRHGLESLG
jgi:hypothetical protein